jgi:hypothetical protein
MAPVFQELAPSKALTRYQNAFDFDFEFEEILAIFDWLPAIVYSWWSILPVLFNTENCTSPNRLKLKVTNVWSMCRNSELQVNTESRYYPNCFIQRSLLPAAFIAGSHCWQWGGVIFENFEGFPLSWKRESRFFDCLNKHNSTKIR